MDNQVSRGILGNWKIRWNGPLSLQMEKLTTNINQNAHK